MLSHPPTKSLCLRFGTICFVLEEHLSTEKCQPRFLSSRMDTIAGKQGVLDINYAAMMP